jgi:hypothetical protein
LLNHTIFPSYLSIPYFLLAEFVFTEFLETIKGTITTFLIGVRQRNPIANIALQGKERSIKRVEGREVIVAVLAEVWRGWGHKQDDSKKRVDLFHPCGRVRSNPFREKYRNI